MTARPDPRHDFDDPDLDCCPHCDEGFVFDCFDGFCVNAEDGCELCMRRCDYCRPAPQAQKPPQD